MLAVKQINEQRSIEKNAVFCPACCKGRLCDKPKKEKVKIVPVQFSPDNGNQIILKCPKCGAIATVFILSE